MNDRDVNVVNDVIFSWISVLPTMRYACALDLMFHVRKSYMIRFHLSFCTINLTPSVFCSFNSLFCFYLSAKEGQKQLTYNLDLFQLYACMLSDLCTASNFFSVGVFVLDGVADSVRQHQMWLVYVVLSKSPQQMEASEQCIGRKLGNWINMKWMWS